MKKYILVFLILASCSDNPVSSSNTTKINYEFWGTAPYEIYYINEIGNIVMERIEGQGSFSTFKEITYTDTDDFYIQIKNIDHIHNVMLKAESENFIYKVYHYDSIEYRFRLHE